jgi:F0F1-type ATP synthase membrane subunit b/b'
MEGHEAVAHGPGLPELFALINVLVLVVVAYVFLRKGVSATFANRAQAIKERLYNSKKELEDIERRIAESQAKLADFEGLKRKMIEDVRREAHALSEKIVAEAEKSAKTLIHEARLAAESESREAMDSIREQLIAEALKNVREQLARDPAMREKMHESMIENFTAQLQGGH